MKRLMLVFMLVMMLSLVSSAQDSLGTFEVNKDVNLFQVCDSCTSITISAVTYPNSSVAASGLSMSSTDNQYYNYTLDGSYVGVLGTYTVNGYDNAGSSFAYDFIITENGLAEPSENIIIFFSIIFFIIMCLSLVTLYSNIVHLASNDTDLMDVFYSIGTYFGLLLFYYFANIYFPKAFVMDLSILFITVLGTTHVFVPFVSLIFATIGRAKSK